MVGGIVGTLVLFIVCSTLIFYVAPQWTLAIAWVALTMTFALALGAGFILRDWALSEPEGRPAQGSFYGYLGGFLLLFVGMGLSLALYSFAPTTLTAPSLLDQVAILVAVNGYLALCGPGLVTFIVRLWRRTHAS